MKIKPLSKGFVSTKHSWGETGSYTVCPKIDKKTIVNSPFLIFGPNSSVPLPRNGLDNS